jgi:hypothetical protein
MLTEYIRLSEAAMPTSSYKMKPWSMARFGQRGGTLAIEYESPSELMKAHAELFIILKVFLAKCGILEPDSFMAADPNFMHARNLKPHITLYKDYKGELPDIALEPITLHPAPTLYPPE